MIGDYNDEAAALARVIEALGHLHSFALLHGPGEMIDETSGLTSDDLAVLLDVLERTKATVLAALEL